MDAPLNEKIERALKRKAARKKNDSNFMPVLSLHEQVLSLVKDANSKVSEERHVTPRSALIVMNRSLADLSTLEDDARTFAVLKDVSRFLNVATKTFTASQTDNTDLLVAGHPLSALNASITAEEFLKKNAQWIAADPSIDESIRPLVASAHAAIPGSIEREHAFARLSANKSLIAAYFKIDNLSPIVAAFGSGNSSAARRARVALQWRDKKGRWVEMGRGVNFRFRLPDGSIQVGSGNYIGAGGDTRVQKTAKGTSLVSDSGLIEVSAVPGLAPGLYVINSNNAVVYQARIPGHAAPEKPSFKDQLNKDIPSLADLAATRRELPIGWKDQGAFYVSDDNYAVIPRNGQPYSVLRLDANGRPTGEAIARVSNWTEVNATINKDEPAFDKYIAKIESDQLPLGRIPDATAKDVINPQDLLKMQEQRMQENKAIDAGKPAPTPLGNNDLNGNPVPEGWVRDVNNDRAYTKELPLRDGGTYPVIARLNEDGTYIAGHSGSWIPEPGTDGRGPAQKFDTLDAVNKDGLPGLIDYLNRTFTKDNPIEYSASKTNKTSIETYLVDFPTLGSSDMFDGIPKLDGLDPTKMTDKESIAKWLEAKGLDRLGVKAIRFKRDGYTPRIEFVIPTSAKDAFGEAYGLNLDENLGDGIDKVGGPGESPTPPSGGTPPKPTSPSTPSAADNLPTLWDSKNSIKKPDGKTFDIVLAEMDEPYNDNTTLMQSVVDQANNLGIYVDLSPEQSGLGFGDERVVRFTFPEKTVSKELAKKLIGSSPDSGDGILLSRIDNQQDWNEAFQEITGNAPGKSPTPPSGGVPPKTPSPNVPSAPGLFNGFNVPDGAFKFNTVEYSPEGRIDEASKDFTDDPKKLATKFTPQELVQAMSQALLGNSTDAAIAEILNANVDSNNDIIDPAAIQDNVDIPQVNVGQPSGAGQLEFSAGAEYVPAEALFNALWEAGLDPNRVIANIYDSANGNNDNLNKLIEAQGGVPSAEETKLVDDIMQEIRQLKDASAPGDSPIANRKQSPSPDPLPGSLIENIPIDFNNPDYYIPNPEAYIPSQPTVDENGYTDNPEILSADYYVADLIEQMLSGITDGSGAALLSFDNITVEVPIEAMRDAIQYQDVNTNQILLDLKKESNDMSEPSVRSDSPALQGHSQMIKDLIEQTGNTVDPETASKIRDAIDQKGLLDWSEANKSEIIDAIAEVAGPAILNPASTPAAERRFPPTTGERQAIETPAAPAPAPTPQAGPPTTGQRQAQEPVQPAETVSVDSPVANNPTPVYPGPENRGYHLDNTVLDVAGKVMGKGTRVRASRDGRMGTVIAVQNIDSRTGERTPYVRVRFDDGSIAVRSALKVRATGEAEAVIPNEAQRQAPTPPPVPDVSARLNAPVLNPGAIATEGNIQGVSSLGQIPDRLIEFTNPQATQKEFSVWGLRAGEIAKAGQTRVALESIKQAAIDNQLAILAQREAPEAQKRALGAEVTKTKEILDAMMKDTYGVREGVAFGKNKYSLSFGGFNVFLGGTKEELQAGNQPMSLAVSMSVLDSNGRSIGSVNRTISGKQVTDPNTGDKNYEWQVKNNYLAINNAKDKKSGFATAYNRFMEDWYIASGVKEIHVQAAGGGSYQGGLVWALNGFNWETPSSAESEVYTRLRMLRRLATDKGEIAQIEDLIRQANAAKLPGGGLDLDKTPTPMDIALVGYYPGAKTWNGKDIMAKNGWMGVKRLDPTAKEQVQSINYDQIRAARKRVEAKENKPNVGREFVMTANSNEFGNKNPELGQYLVEIRDVLQNNRSLAVLSPAAKTALNTYVTKQLLTKEGRDLPMQDIFQLRKALHAEAKADNPLLSSTDFGVGTDLASATIEDISQNKVKGFDIKRLGMYESGYNDTWLATHVASGQRFYVKKDDLATNYDISGPLSEIAATNIARGIGFEGAYNTLASSDNPNVLVMQEAGSTLPLGSEPRVASKVYDGTTGTLVALDGSKVTFNGDNFINKMHTPEDAARVVLLDLLINNQDRHNGNILYALDGVDPSKIRVFPIDHSLSSFALKPGDRNQYLFDAILGEGDGKIYDLTMPALTRAMKEEDLLALFRNEANNLRESLKDGNIQLAGKELDMVIAQWGSLNNYRDAINQRLDAMLKPNGAVHARFLRILKPSFWN